MTALVIILAVIALALAVALAMTLKAQRRDQQLVESREAQAHDHRQRLTEASARAERSEADKHHARADATEQLAKEQVARERAEAELHEARLRIAALEQRRDTMEEEAGETPRRSLFRRTSSEVDPHDAEPERSGLGRGD
jgi:hypothetical protein